MNATSTREQLQLAIIRIAKRAANSRRSLNIDDMAIRLSSRYPQSGMTLDEICTAVASQIEKERNRCDCRD